MGGISAEGSVSKDGSTYSDTGAWSRAEMAARAALWLERRRQRGAGVTVQELAAECHMYPSRARALLQALSRRAVPIYAREVGTTADGETIEGDTWYMAPPTCYSMPDVE
jgi:hypothetical protein